LHVKALLAQRKDDAHCKSYEILGLLREAKRLHLQEVELATSMSLDLFTQYTFLDPDFKLELAHSIFQTCSCSEDANRSTTSLSTELPLCMLDGVELLNKIVAMAPAITQTYVMRARAFLVFSRADEAFIELTE
jgi:hypothetical protein